MSNIGGRPIIERVALGHNQADGPFCERELAVGDKVRHADRAKPRYVGMLRRGQQSANIRGSSTTPFALRTPIRPETHRRRQP